MSFSGRDDRYVCGENWKCSEFNRAFHVLRWGNEACAPLLVDVLIVTTMGGGRHFLSHFPLFIRPSHRAKAITAGLLLLGFVPGFILSRWCPLLVINLFQDPHRTNLDDFQSLWVVSDVPASSAKLSLPSQKYRVAYLDTWNVPVASKFQRASNRDVAGERC